MSSLINVTESNFESLVVNSNKPVVVDFWAEWCGPCKALSPILDEVSKEMGEKATIVKLNVDSESNLAQKFGIRGIPTLIFFKDGQIHSTLVGNQPKAEIIKTLNSLV